MAPQRLFSQRDHLVLPERGRVSYAIAGDRIDLAPGELLLIPAGLPPHAWWVRGARPWAARWLQLRLSDQERARLRYGPSPSGMVHLPASAERQAAIDPLMRRLLQLRGRGDAAAAALRQLLVRALLQEIVLFHGPPAAPRSEAVARVLGHLDRHLADHELALPELVRVAGCARSVLMERFTREVGQPPIRYLEERRLAVAADWLQNSEDPVALIAAGVGYPDSRYFATRFRRRFGLSPRAYRARTFTAPAVEHG